MPEFLRLNQLWSYYLRRIKILDNPYIAELYVENIFTNISRIAYIASISLSFINPRTGRSVNIVIALLLFVIYNNLMGVSHSLVSTGVISIWFGYWPIHLIFGLLAYIYYIEDHLILPLFPKN